MKKSKKTIAPARRIGISRLTNIGLAKLSGITLIVVLALSACDKKDASEYYHPNVKPGQPPLENPGQVVVTPPSIPSTPGEPEQPAPPPAPIIIVDKDGNAQEIVPGEATDVESGTYVMTTVTTPSGPAVLPAGIAISPATATTPGTITIPPASSGSEGIGILTTLPQILAGTGTMTVTPGGVTTSAIQLVAMTREVALEGVLQGLDPSILSSAVFTLEGVLNTRRIDQPFAPATKTRAGLSAGRAASLYAAQTSFSIEANGNFATSVRLLGIDPAAKQRLVLTLTYKDTTVPPYVYSTDVTALLAGFNTGATNQPAHLQAQLSFGLDGITGTITGWTPTPPIDIPGE